MIVTMTRNKSMRMKIKSTDIIKIVKNEKQCKRKVDFQNLELKVEKQISLDKRLKYLTTTLQRVFQ